MILIVDDDPVFLEQAREIFDAGRGIFLAPDTARAWELLDLLGYKLSVALVDLYIWGLAAGWYDDLRFF